MARRTIPAEPVIMPKQWSSPEDIDRAVTKLQRRISELEALDIQAAVLEDTGLDDVAISNVRETIREVFGQSSPEFDDHQHIRLWAGGMYVGMSKSEIVQGTERGRKQVIGILNGLIGSLGIPRDSNKGLMGALGIPRDSKKGFMEALGMPRDSK